MCIVGMGVMGRAVIPLEIIIIQYHHCVFSKCESIPTILTEFSNTSSQNWVATTETK